MKTQSEASTAIDTSDREIVIWRAFRAPRELVWKAWTDPELVVKWWGPRGFTTTIETMDLRVGGVWKLMMHGPDGTNFPNKSIFKEIVPFERIVYSHGGGREDGDGSGANFVATWTFEDAGEGMTRLTGRMVFPSKEARDTVVREYGAIEGGRQTLERLSEQIPAMQSEPFVFTRDFDAPLDLVWRAWTEREQFARWFGPKGFTIRMKSFDLRPGGMCHYSMVTPDGKEMWGKAVYREVVPQRRLVWINSSSDPDGGITRHPFTKDPWPLQMLTTVTFAESGGRTAVTVHWLPYESDEEERRVFNAGRGSMSAGWGGTLKQLESFLANG
ncbi:MAG TPA: SRPBCC domain-containing protein [Opitutaceae bacterium]|nr:SRPBCC domain-containing protein [Opitutaceae bacterium]